MYLQIVSYTLIGITTLVATFNRKQLLKSSEKYFLYYLVFIVIHELVAFIQNYYFKISTFVNYNIFDIVSYSFLIYWFYKILDNKKTITFLGIIYIINIIISLIIEDFFNSYLKINIFGSTIVILILTMSFYTHLLKKREVVSFTNNPQFWITTGLLIFNIGYLPVLILLNLSNFNSLYVDFGITILNILMYGCFIKAFLCYK